MPDQRAWRLGRSLLLLPVLNACDGSPQGAHSTTVRDSAGITIVENSVASATTWRLSETPVVELDPTLPVEQLPLDPTAVFTDANKRIIAGDGNQSGWHAILVYDSAGRFLAKIGGRGRGPGEFAGQLWSAGPYRGDSIVAWDRRGPSMKIFGADGGYARDVAIPSLGRRPPDGTFGFSIGFHGAFDDGRLLTSSEGILEIPARPGPAWYSHLLLVVEPDGSARDTIGEFRLAERYWDGSSQDAYMFGPSTTALPYGNGLLIGSSATYEYQIRARDGRIERIVRKSFEPVPVGDADIAAVVRYFLEAGGRQGMTEEARDELRRTVEAYPRAPAKPAYSSIIVDPEQHVWVERFRWLDPWSLPPDPQPTVWDVFTPGGEWIAEIVAPAGVVLLSVSADKAYGVRIDEDDVRHVVVFGIAREQD